MFSDENKSSSLAKFLNNYDYVILDTCSLMEDSFPFFMDTLVNARTYLKEDGHIVIYNECLEELKKHSKNKHDDSVRIAAKRALKIIGAVKWKRIFEFPKKEKNPNFADNIIYVNVSQRRITQKILVITQDKGLAEDLRKLNLLDSQQGRKVSVYRIMNDGTLDLNKGYQQKHNIHRDFNEAKERPLFAKAKKTDFDDVLNKAIQGDKRLWANIANPNYPADRKKKDIEQQLSLLGQLSDERKKNAKLQLSETRLKEELNATAKPAEAKAPAAPKAEPKPVEIPVKAPAAEPIKKEEKQAPAPAEKQAPGYYGDGLTFEAAIADLGSRSGQIFRDPSIPYFPMIHGPKDLTTLDLARIAKGLKESPSSYTYKDMNFWSKPAGRGFHVWFRKLEPKTEEVAAPVKEEQKLEVVVKEEPKVEAAEKKSEEKAEEKSEVKAEEPAPKPAKKKKKTKKVVEKEDDGVTDAMRLMNKPIEVKSAAPTPKKKATVSKKKAAKEAPAAPAEETKAVGSLVVAIPDDKKQRESIERRTRFLSDKKTSFKAAEKPAETRKKSKAKSAKKQEEPKKTSKKAEKAKTLEPKTETNKAVKEEAPKAKTKKAKAKKTDKKADTKVESPIKKEPAKKTAKKKEKPAKAEDVVKPDTKQQPAEKAKKVAKVDDFAAAKKAEARLQSVLSNGNYPKKNKLADIKSQIALVNKLKSEEAAQLLYNVATLKTMASMLD